MPDDTDMIDTRNDFFIEVGFQNGEQTFGFFLPPGVMDQDTALRTAAWLVALADPFQEKFPAVFQAVCNT